MLKKFTKVSVLVLLMASSISLTSCKKEKNVAPDTTEQDAKDKEAQDAKDKEAQDAKDKEAQDAKDAEEKARVQKALLINAWQEPYGVESTEELFFGLDFSTDDVEVYEYSGEGPINGKFNYTLSDDGKKITIDGITYEIVEITDKVLKLKTQKGNTFTFNNVGRITVGD